MTIFNSQNINLFSNTKINCIKSPINSPTNSPNKSPIKIGKENSPIKQNPNRFSYKAPTKRASPSKLQKENSPKKYKIDPKEFTIEKINQLRQSCLQESKYVTLQEASYITLTSISKRLAPAENIKLIKSLVGQQNRLDDGLFEATARLFFQNKFQIPVSEWLKRGGRPILSILIRLIITNQEFDTYSLRETISTFITKEKGVEALLLFFNATSPSPKLIDEYLETFARDFDPKFIIGFETDNGYFRKWLEFLNREHPCLEIVKACGFDNSLIDRFLRSPFAELSNIDYGWEDLFQDEITLKRALNLVENDPVLALKYLDKSDLFRKEFSLLLPLLESDEAITVFKTAIFSNPLQFTAVTEFIAKYGPGSNQLKNLALLLKHYPTQMIILCRLIDLKSTEVIDEKCIKLLIDNKVIGIGLLDLLSKFQDKHHLFLQQIIDLHFKEPSFAPLIPTLTVMEPTVLDDVIDNLDRELWNPQSYITLLLERMADEDHLFILCTLGTLSHSKYDRAQCKKVLRWFDDTSVCWQPIVRLMKLFHFTPFSLPPKITSMFFYLLEKERGRLSALANKIRSPSSALLKQLYLLLQSTPDGLEIYKNLNFNTQFSLQIHREIHSLLFGETPYPPSFLNNIYWLIHDCNDAHALQLLIDWKEKESARPHIERWAKLGLKHPSFGEALARVRSEFDMEKLQPLPAYDMHCDVLDHYPENEAKDYFLMVEMAKDDPGMFALYQRALQEFSKAGRLSIEMMVMIIASVKEGPARCLELLSYFSNGFNETKAEHAKILSHLRNCNFDKAYLAWKSLSETHRVNGLGEVKRTLNATISALKNVLRAHPEYLSEEESLYRAATQNFLHALTAWTVQPDEGIDLDRALQFLSHPGLEEVVPYSLIQKCLNQVNLLKKRPKTLSMIASLTFSRSQQSEMAFLIRSSLHLEHDTQVEDHHLMAFAFLLLAMDSRQSQDVGSCAAVALLNNMIQNNPEHVVELIRVFSNSEKMTAKRKNGFWNFYLNLFPNYRRLDEPLSIQIKSLKVGKEDLHSLPPIEKVARYCRLSDEKRRAWVNEALEMLKKEHPHQDRILHITHKEFVDALLKASGNMIPDGELSAGQQISTVYLSDFYPLHRSAFESLLISMDTTASKMALKIFIEVFNKYVEHVFNAKNISSELYAGLLDQFRNIFQNKISIIFDQNKNEAIMFNKEIGFLRNLPDFFDLFLACSQEALHHAHHTDLQWKDACNETLNLLTSCNFVKECETSLTNRPSMFWIPRNEFRPQLIYKNIFNQKADTVDYACQKIENALLFIFNHATRNIDPSLSKQHYGIIPKHGLNFLFNHRTLSELNEDRLRELPLLALKLQNETHLRRHDLMDCLEKVAQQMQSESQEAFQDMICKLLPKDEYSVKDVRDTFEKAITDFLGSRALTQKFFMQILDRSVFEKLDPEKLKPFAFLFADLNWCFFKTFEDQHLCCFFHPISMKWQEWIATDKGRPVEETNLIHRQPHDHFVIFKR